MQLPGVEMCSSASSLSAFRPSLFLISSFDYTTPLWSLCNSFAILATLKILIDIDLKDILSLLH